MKIDNKLNQLPLTKSKPSTLQALFGNTDLTPMWVADLDFAIAKPIQEALTQRITDSGFGYEYKPDSFFVAQKQWYQERYAIDLDKSHLLFSPTITTTIAALIEHVTDERDGVITQPPVFMEFRDVIRKTNRRVIKNPLQLKEDSYGIDFDDLAEKAKLDYAKILIICNPHNPVGRVWTRKELKEVVRICKENDLLLISDEIHKDIILFGNQFTSALHFIDDYDKIVVCNSEAKTFNLCGITDSLAIIPNEMISNGVSSIFKKYNLGRTNALTRVALEAAYSHGQPWLDEVIKIVEQNVNTIENALADSQIGLLKPEGTYQVWLDFRAIYEDTKEMFRDITDKSGVALNAGHWFGREGALFMRMNVGTSNERIVDGIGRIKVAVADVN